MLSYLKFVVLTLCLELVSILFVLAVNRHQQHSVGLAPSLVHALGKEYALVQSKHNEETLETWNYSYCDSMMMRNNPYVVKLTEDSGEFLLTAKIRPLVMRFQLGKEFVYGNGQRCTMTLNDTTLIQRGSTLITTMDFTSDEMQLVENIKQSNTPLIFKPRQVEDDSNRFKSILDRLKPISSSSAPSLAPALGKEYVLEHSKHNRQTFRAWGYSTCQIDSLTKVALVMKLAEDQGEFVFTSVLEVLNVKFQLGKPTVDSRGVTSTFTLDGTTLTRVAYGPCHDLAPSTSTWKFGTEELLLQEFTEVSNASLTFKLKNPSLSK